MIRGYLRLRRAVLALYATVALLFPAVQLLYGAPMEPVAYSLLIITFLTCLCMTADFFQFRARAKRLDALLENPVETASALPEPVGPMELRYHQLCTTLHNLLHVRIEDAAQVHNERIEYYTMWVHQIKTPIAAMRLYMQNRPGMDIMETELFKVERYVEMALQFVKLDDLSSDLLIEEVSLSPLISASVKKYAPLFIEKKIGVHIAPGDLCVPTDGKWFSFVLEQLLSNAIKYTQKGHVAIRLEGMALIVEDTGIGIRSEDIARVFHKGYTGYNGRVDQRASGIGLYMAKRVANQLSIRIYPESTLGKGTTMTLVFPKKSTHIQ